ncbi:MAG: ABC exporter membrane fusion protein [Cyanobacteria bacterium P01_H01_bin.162]
MGSDLLNQQMEAVSRPRRRSLLLGAAAVAAIGVTAGWIWQNQGILWSGNDVETVAPAPIPTVTALGRLEPEGEAVSLVAPTTAQETRIGELLVAEGDLVNAGQVVAILDNRDQLQAALRSAEEQVRIAQAQLDQVEAGVKTGELQAQEAEIARFRAEEAGTLATQQATINRLAAEVENARLEYQRYESLYQQGAISASERDTKKLTYDTAQQQRQEAQAELARLQTTTQEQIARAEATLDQLAEVRPVDVELAAAELAAAQAAVAAAQVDLDKAYVQAPQAGQVVKIHTRPGENIASEGIVTLGNTQQMMAIAEVYQSDIQRIQVGQPVTITSPVIAGELNGTVERIGLQVESQQVVDENPAANIDAKVIEVHVRLDEAASAAVAGLTNLQVTVSIVTE